MINDYRYERNIPSLDLHGLSRDIARSNLVEFIKDSIKLKTKYIRIVHGIGDGVLREEVKSELKNNPSILEYRLEIGNPGATIAMIKLF